MRDTIDNNRLSALEALVARAFSSGALTGGAFSTFVFRPGGVQAGNVYTSWAPLLAAVAPVQGPIVIQVDTSLGAAVVPTSAAQPGAIWNFGAGKNVQIRGSLLGGTSTLLTIQDGAQFNVNATFQFTDMFVVFQGNTALFTVPLATPKMEIRFDGPFNEGLQCTGAAAFAAATAGLGVVQVTLADAAILVSGTCFSAAGAGAQIRINAQDLATISASTITASGGASILINQISTASTVSTTQTPNLVFGSTLFTTCGFKQYAFTDATSTVAPVPANQTTPGANTDILAAVLIPAASGLFVFAGNVSGVASNGATTVVTFTVRSHTKTAAFPSPLGNGTATGTNCFFAAASGTLTYGGGTTDATHYTEAYTVPTGAGNQVPFDYAGIINGTAGGGGFTQGNNTAVALAVQTSAGNFNTITGSLSMYELP